MTSPPAGTSPSVTALDSADAMRKLGSAGRPLLHTEVRLVGDAGNITPGYWNNPAATASSFQDGWLKTGDAARFDDEGFVFIVDQWKDMYISEGENVYPAEVENVR